MQAIVYREFGSPDVLRCEEMQKPAPRKAEVLVRVRAAGLNPLDWRLMEVKPLWLRALLGLHKTKRPGVDLAGVVEEVGEGVSAFKPGDAVFGLCRGGALAESACAPASSLALKPAEISYEQAAAVPVAGLTALQGLRDKARVQPGQRVLINGAAGGVGTFAVQIAKWMGAEVTGVCSGAGAEARSRSCDRLRAGGFHARRAEVRCDRRSRREPQAGGIAPRSGTARHLRFGGSAERRGNLLDSGRPGAAGFTRPLQPAEGDDDDGEAQAG